MSSPDFLGEPRTPRLHALLSEIRRGQIRVPRFQRPFVWTEEQRLNLVESIYLGYPIGSILVWRTQKQRVATYDRLGPMRLPAEDESDKVAIRQYLLDGHQRMSTLFAALGPGISEQDEEPILELVCAEPDDEDERDRWPLYFDLENQKFYAHRKAKVPSTWVRLDILYDSYALGEYKDALRQAKMPREMLNRVQRLADIFRDYTIPVVPIATDDLEQVTISFKRVNSGGTKMSEVHMVNALTWQPAFDLHKRLEKVAESLTGCGWDEFDPQLLLNICKVRLEHDIYKADIEKLAKQLREKPSLLDEARDAVAAAADILANTVQIMGSRAIPYGYQMVLLADLMWRRPLGLTSQQQSSLARWVWITSLSEHMSGMTNSRFERIRHHLWQVVEENADPRPPDAVLITDSSRVFNWQGARSRAHALLLAAQQPRDPLYQHDPFLLLAEHGAKCMVKLISDSELPGKYQGLAHGPENRFLLDPRNGRVLRNALSNSAGTTYALSHLISPEAHAALCNGDLVSFLSMRRERITDVEQKKARDVGLLEAAKLT